MVVDSQGHLTASSSGSVVERVAGAKRQCSQIALQTAFNATCRYTDHSNGHVEVGPTGFPEWWQESVTSTYYGTRVSHGTSHSLNDALIPLTAGHWNAAQILGLLGFKSVPPGVTFDLKVRRVK